MGRLSRQTGPWKPNVFYLNPQINFEGGRAMTLGEVCEHGSLKRQCLVCELMKQLRAADELARAVKGWGRTFTASTDVEQALIDALAAYEEVRGLCPKQP